MKTAQAKAQSVGCLENEVSVQLVRSETGELPCAQIEEDHMCHGQENGFSLLTAGDQGSTSSTESYSSVLQRKELEVM